MRESKVAMSWVGALALLSVSGGVIFGAATVAAGCGGKTADVPATGDTHSGPGPACLFTCAGKFDVTGLSDPIVPLVQDIGTCTQAKCKDACPAPPGTTPDSGPKDSGTKEGGTSDGGTTDGGKTESGASPSPSP